LVFLESYIESTRAFIFGAGRVLGESYKLSLFNGCLERLAQVKNLRMSVLDINQYFEKVSEKLNEQLRKEEAIRERERKTQQETQAKAEELARRAQEQEEEAKRLSDQQQENERKHQIEREQKRAEWLMRMKAYASDLEKQHEVNRQQQKLADSKLTELFRSRENSVVIQSSSISFSTPMKRTFAAWQPDLLAKITEEENLLRRVYQHLKTTSEQDRKYTVEDHWIEQEALRNILGRLMELVKGFHGKQIALPRKAAEGIRNIILKHDYFPFIPESGTSADTLQAIGNKTKQLHLAVANLLAFFDKDNVTGIAPNWDAVRVQINSPLLDDMVAKCTQPEYGPWDVRSMDRNKCEAKVRREDELLMRLQKYKAAQTGVFADKANSNNVQLLEIVKLAIESRWGAVSAFVRDHKHDFFQPPDKRSGSEQALYNYLVRPEYIIIGNEFRHVGGAPLLFSKKEAPKAEAPKVEGSDKALNKAKVSPKPSPSPSPAPVTSSTP
jgi:hypothetical protein